MKQYFRITMLWLAVAMIAPMLTSCDEFFGLIDNPVTPALRVYTETLVVGEGHSLKINATTQDHVMLTYASSDPSVAIVDAEGNVIGVSEGKATITVTAQGDDDYYRNQIFGTNTHAVDVAVVKYDPTAIKLLADAQKEGALVSITFNLDGTNYIAYFRLVNGEYVLQDGPAATRAAARGVTRSLVEEYMEEKERRVWRTMTEGIELSLISILMGDEAQNSGSAGSGSTTPGTASTQNSVLMATWVDKETGNAIAQAQIDGATAAVSMVNAASADANGHAVAMGDVQVNSKNAYSDKDQGKANNAKASAAAGKTTGNESGSTSGRNSDKSSNFGSIAATDYKFTENPVYIQIGDTHLLKYTYTPNNAKISFSIFGKDNNLISLNKETGRIRGKAKGDVYILMKTLGINGFKPDNNNLCHITIIDPNDIEALYKNVVSFDIISSAMVSNFDIKTLVGDFAYKAEDVFEGDGIFLVKKICKKKSLSNVVLFLDGNEEYGYTFYFFNETSSGKVYLKSTDAIPSDWIGATLFYVEKETASVGGGEN